MNNIVFDEGLKEYTINGDESRIIRVDTTDYAILERATQAEKNVSKYMEQYSDIKVRADGTADCDDQRAYEAVIGISKMMSDQINYIFNAQVADVVFNGASPMSTKGGVTLFERFLNAFMPIIKSDIEKENKEAQKRVEKYTKEAQRFKNKL